MAREQYPVGMAERSLASREKRAAEAADDVPNILEAFEQLLGAFDKHAPKHNIEISFPCGTRLKIVCLDSARQKAVRARKRAANAR